MKRTRLFTRRLIQTLFNKEIFTSWRGVYLEIALIVIWAVFVGTAFLDPNPYRTAPGREWGMSTHTHYLWINFLKCGACAFWNGSVNGGYPAFTELHGSVLHPIVMIATWIFGALNGSKIALVAAIAVAGIAQWWLAKELGLSRITRLWVAFIAAAGGHIAGRLEHGSFQTAFSTAICSLVIPAIVATAKGKKYGIPLLAITGASAALSGSGYMQIGVIVGMAPALIFLLIGKDFKIRPLWKSLILAIGLSLLMSAPLLVPFLNNFTIYIKDVEASFGSTQPIGYILLNLFIEDPAYYFSDVFWKLPYPYLYTLFIGWIPLVFWCLGLFLSRKEDHRWIGFFTIGAITEVAISSTEFLRTAAKYFPPVMALRNPSLIAGLAVPFILGVSSIGLDRLLKLSWPELILSQQKNKIKAVTTKWLLVVPLLISLRASYTFSQEWLYTQDLLPEIAATIEDLHTSSFQWVHTPFGEHWFIAPAIADGLKLTRVFDTFRWEGYEYPRAYLTVTRHDPSFEPDKKLVAENFGVNVLLDESVDYAIVISDQGPASCAASGSGGNIDVICVDVPAGELMVQEKMWSGWKATVDGEPADLIHDKWLSVKAPAGTHIYTFRFRPWDVPLGIGLFIVGLILCGWFYYKTPQPKSASG